jgi:four helix bundle protein
LPTASNPDPAPAASFAPALAAPTAPASLLHTWLARLAECRISQVYDRSSDGAFACDLDLRDQMRRAAASIMSNIAEGFESRTDILFLEFLGRAKDPAGELRAELYVARDAGYIAADQLRMLQDLCAKCSSQISRIMSYLQRGSSNQSFRRSDVQTFRRSA